MLLGMRRALLRRGATVSSVSVSAAGSATTVEYGATLQLSATVTGVGGPSQAVTWSQTAGGGSISAAGLITANGAANTGATLTYRATSNQDPTKYGEITITLIPPQTGLAHWVEARLGSYTDAGTTLATNGQAVAYLKDFAPNARHMTQGTAGAKPTYVSTGFGTASLPYLDFGGDDYLSNNSLASDIMGTDVVRTCIIAGKFDATTAGSQLFALGQNGSANPRHHCDIGGSTDWRLLVRDNAGLLKSTAGGTADTNAHIFTYDLNAILGNIYIDGTLVAGPTDMDVDSVTLDRATIGALDSNGAVTAFLDGRHAAQLVYTAIVTQRRVNAQGYLNAVYGVY